MPIQAYLFAKIINVFTLSGEAMLHSSEHWSLMWFVLAICVGCCYFTMAFSSTMLEYVSAIPKKYLSAFIADKP